nr:MAG TPA: hypothetical protein [Bacteriophage sp.]
MYLLIIIKFIFLKKIRCRRCNLRLYIIYHIFFK